MGVANAGAVEALSQILELVQSGVLPRSVSYSAAEDLMSQGKLAMMISGPWAWANLMKTGIDFGVAPIPGCGDHPAKPFVGVSAAYINRASSNQDIAKEFIESFLTSEEGLKAMNDAKPIGIPSLTSLAEQMDQDEPAPQGDEDLHRTRRGDAEHPGNGPVLDRGWLSAPTRNKWTGHCSGRSSGSRREHAQTLIPARIVSE